jgi:hypothetical protein
MIIRNILILTVIAALVPTAMSNVSASADAEIALFSGVSDSDGLSISGNGDTANMELKATNENGKTKKVSDFLMNADNVLYIKVGDKVTVKDNVDFTKAITTDGNNNQKAIGITSNGVIDFTGYPQGVSTLDVVVDDDSAYEAIIVIGEEKNEIVNKEVNKVIHKEVFKPVVIPIIGDPCLEDPTLEGCEDPCLEDPTLEGCIPIDPCEEDPNAEGCIPIDPCEEDPNAEGCIPIDPCEEDPNAEGCIPIDPCEEDPTQPQCVEEIENVPLDCEADPSNPDCQTETPNEELVPSEEYYEIPDMETEEEEPEEVEEEPEEDNESGDEESDGDEESGGSEEGTFE